jgi:hypothetical protein
VTTTQREAGGQAPRRTALFGWSPPDLPAGAALGHSLISGYEQPVFLAVLAASVLFECGWSTARGTNALGRGTGTRRGTGAAGCGPGAAGCGTGAVPER